MSKKDKKRIAELERQQSILLATMRVLRKDFNTLSLSIVHDKIDAIRAANSFQAGTIPSEKEQEKAEQSKPAMTEKEQELMGKLNAELGKFVTLEAFNADRVNKFLPPVGKLEFHKMKAAIECTIAIAKMVRPDYFEQIDQIKIPKEGQEKPEQRQPENHRENLGEPILNKANQFKKGQFDAEKLDANLSKLASLPLKSEQELAGEKRANRINATLKLLVDDLAKHLNFTLENFGKDRAKQVEMLQIYCDNFKEDLADFRRKVLSVSELVEAKQDEPKQDTPTLCELERGKAEKVETEQPETADASAKKDGWFYAIWADVGAGASRLYVSKSPYLNTVSDDNKTERLAFSYKIQTTPNKAEALQYDNIETARKQIESIKLLGADNLDIFGACELRALLIYTDEKEAEKVEPILPAPEQKEADKSGTELGGTDGADSPKSGQWAILFRSNSDQKRLGYLWKVSDGMIQLKEFLCEAKWFNSHQKVLDYIEIYKDAFIKASHIESRQIKYEIIQI